jgi:DNA-binding response OmpR family regulator
MNNSAQETILLIEKDEVTLELYQRELCKSFQVVAFTSLEGVLDRIRSKDIHAVIIEPEIGGGQGWDLIDVISRTFPDQDMPVIVCTTRDLNNQMLRKQLSGYLTKPVLPRFLREKTLEILNSKAR